MKTKQQEPRIETRSQEAQVREVVSMLQSAEMQWNQYVWCPVNRCWKQAWEMDWLVKEYEKRELTS